MTIDKKRIIATTIKESSFFLLFLSLGILIIPPLGEKLNFWNNFIHFKNINPEAVILMFTPYTIFLLIRVIYSYILKQSLKFPWQQIYSYATREIFYMISFFVLGCIFMPFTAKLVGIVNYDTKTMEALLSFDPTIYFLASIPYFVFIFVRLLLKYLRKLWVKIKKREEESNYENWKNLSDYKDMMIVTIVLLSVSLALYVTRPKPMYKNFYGKSKICECFGGRINMKPENVFWGKENKDWGVCFGVLYNCQEDQE